MNLMNATESVVSVGKGGRGFLVEANMGPVVITAAHCLPHFPPSHAASYAEERTYAALLGNIGEEPTIWTECLFVDPIADIAVLGEPDVELYEEWKAFDEWISAIKPLLIADVPPDEEVMVRLLSLDLRWVECTARHTRGPFWPLIEARIESGMSGSPILNTDGRAVGVVCVSGGLNPRLVRSLPGWLLDGVLQPRKAPRRAA